MGKKFRENTGLTVIEMMVATLVLMLLALMLGTGLQMALHSYETVVAQAELELLVSTAVDAIADDLRYARDVTHGNEYEYTTADDGTVSPTSITGGFTYTSDSFYGEGAYLALNSDHQIRACTSTYTNGMRVLSTGSYGSGGVSYKEYWVTYLKVTPTYNASSGEVAFTIELTAKTADGKLSASTPSGGVTVRCLNPYKTTT